MHLPENVIKHFSNECFLYSEFLEIIELKIWEQTGANHMLSKTSI